MRNVLITLVAVSLLVPGATAAASFQTWDFTVPAAVHVGSLVQASAVVANMGDDTGTALVELIINNRVAFSRTVTLEAGSGTRLSWNFTPTLAGNYSLSLRVGSEIIGPKTLQVLGLPVLDVEDVRASPLIPGSHEIRLMNALNASSLVLRIEYDPSVARFEEATRGDLPGSTVSAVDRASEGYVDIFVATAVSDVVGDFSVARLSWTAVGFESESTELSPKVLAYRVDGGRSFTATAMPGMLHTSLLGDALGGL